MLIDGVEYQPVDRTGERLQIVVLHRGFVFVGKVTDEENEVVIRDAQNIRRWGTSYGLGQIAEEGPQKETRLDPSGVIRCHPLAVVCRYDCKPEVWPCDC